jgi:hypothetical protein
MWTPEHRRAANRSGLRYPSDLTDAEWAIVEPLIPPAKHGGRKHSSRDLLEVSAVRPSSPVRSQPTIGTRLSPIPPSPTPSSTASSTTLTASHSRETACAPLSVPNLTPIAKTEPTPHAGNDTRPPSSEKVAAFHWNAWPRSIGIPGRNRRNPQAVCRDNRWRPRGGLDSDEIKAAIVACQTDPSATQHKSRG